MNTVNPPRSAHLDQRSVIANATITITVIIKVITI